jgi:serine/threonine protein kinase
MTRVIGQYRVTNVLGEGGMGVVYAAEHTLLGRPAALKLLLPELSSKQEIVQRFFNEARAATAIRHPGIVEVYDFGWTSDRERSAYIVMELLDGETLRARRKRGLLRWSTALALARQIAGALAAAHAKGIVHRDLKPDNIFLVPDDDIPGGERIKLLDFGIAKLASAAPGQNRTRTGMVMGTPTYMAPEQCRGIAVDARADLYSVGCILFELCTGRPPFVGEGEGDVLVAHIHTPPPAMATLASGIPKEVESLVQRLLAKSPADRVQSADELLRLIDAARSALGQAGMSGQHPILVLPPAAAPERGDNLDAPTSAAPEDPRGAKGEPTMDVRSSSRRPRRDAVAPAPLAAKAEALATTEMASSPRLRTTLSSAAGTISLDGPLDEPPATSRRLKLIGGSAGGVAAFGVLALVFATLLGGNDDAPIQAAAAPPSETAPPTTAEPAPGGPVTPVPAEVIVPSAPPALPSAPPPTTTPSTPPPAKETPSPPPTAAAAPPEKAPPLAAPEPKSPPADKPAPKLPSKSSSGATASAKPTGPQSTEVTIHIESYPSGAGIYRGDVYFGPTPRDFGLERGDYDYKLELRLPGYQPYEFTVHPTQSLRIPLMKMKRLPKSSPSSQTPPAPQPAPSADPSTTPPQPAAPAAPSPEPPQPTAPAQ